MDVPIKADPDGPEHSTPTSQPGLEGPPAGPAQNASTTSTTSTTPDSPAVPATPETQHDQPKSQHTLKSYEYLQQLSSLNDPVILEKGVQAGVKFLLDIKESLKVFLKADGTETARWIKAIDDLCARPRHGRTIVGVVGNTGAGKSSVINAVLDEERLLPTNGMRACTASATEVSYNHSDNPAQLYRAEIEFINYDEWLRELDGLFHDLIDSSGRVFKESSNPDTDAGRAYAKIAALYPKLTKDMIAQSHPQTLADDPAVRRVLGTTMKFQANAAITMYRQLQYYVDSKEKTAVAGESKEFWPLIKVVRIYTKAAALSTGAVIVDLPGVQDSNAARAAVAANYMKQCSGLWIVAPITRAVDDKTAKKLLGDQFKRQLKYDGAFSSVTFICSKTDDISITEAADSLRLDEELADDWGEIDCIKDETAQLTHRLSDLKDQKAALGETLTQVEEDIELWEDLEDQIAEGRRVYASSVKRSKPEGKKKRKRQTKPSGSRKNRLSIDTDSDDENDNNDQVSLMSDAESLSGSDKENGNAGKKTDRVPLTEEQIAEKLASLKAQKKTLRQTRKDTDLAISGVKEEIREMQVEKSEIESKIKSLCIKGRNTYSRQAIKRDFASGIKELDEEAAMQLDEDSFDPEQELRDYDKVAESLPVFCVSSRAFQQLRGRLKKDNFSSDGFTVAEDTEIPQLQEHAKQMTVAARMLIYRVLLNDISQLLTSMKLWADNDGASQLSKVDRENEQARLTQHLTQLDRNLQQCIHECINSLKEELAENIFDAFLRTIPLAQEAAPRTAEGWGGQMRWATYKATVRRNGVFAGAAGPRDFQAELWEPIAVQLAGNWERAFQRRVPAVLDAFVGKATSVLHDFHLGAISYAREHFINLAGVAMLDQQLATYKMRVKEIPGIAAGIIQEIQREASRSFEPAIEQDMRPAYNLCSQESGSGSFARMKNHMRDHVEQARGTMFNHATDTVRSQLKAMCEAVCQELGKQILENIFKNLSQDYLEVLGTNNNKAASGITRGERMLRGELSMMLAQPANKVFKDDMEDFSEQEAADQLIEENHGVKQSDEESSGGASDTMSEGGREGRHESVDLGMMTRDQLFADDASDNSEDEGSREQITLRRPQLPQPASVADCSSGDSQ